VKVSSADNCLRVQLSKHKYGAENFTFFTIFLTFIPTISESKSLQSTAIEGKNKLEREKATQ